MDLINLPPRGNCLGVHLWFLITYVVLPPSREVLPNIRRIRGHIPQYRLKRIQWGDVLWDFWVKRTFSKYAGLGCSIIDLQRGPDGVGTSEVSFILYPSFPLIVGLKTFTFDSGSQEDPREGHKTYCFVVSFYFRLVATILYETNLIQRFKPLCLHGGYLFMRTLRKGPIIRDYVLIFVSDNNYILYYPVP